MAAKKSPPRRRPAASRVVDNPLATPGLISYRYSGPNGWVMIGAKDDADAMREATRSVVGYVSVGRLQRWNGAEYVALSARPPALSMPGAHFADSPAQRQDFSAFTARERAAAAPAQKADEFHDWCSVHGRNDRCYLSPTAKERAEERAIARRLFTYPLHGDPANVVPVASVEDAQDKWIEYRDRAGSSGPGVRSAEIGSGVVVVDELGREVARISYNGRIWPAGEPGPGESRAPKPLQALWPEQIRRAVEAMPGNPKPKANLLRLALKNDRKALLYIDQFLAKHGGLEGAERAEIRRMNQNPEGRALLAKKLTFEDGVVDIRSKGVGQNARIGGTWRHPVRNGAVIVLDQRGDTWTAMDGAARRYHGKTAADAVDKALAVMNAEIFGGT